ncbi:hypothetical protein SeLEV6574_g00173 [Synchytrium endobioticum]|uniref:Uncharacterized protein n=1 Tax=Synchytrium endobioticum TaxID=286115 RepID=A0A507DJB5_9FUNG|nr:hypothetical protein SeLEV6574_g00194 [Synchytrium endobioticum]TPX51607.1 hypothetical protein SeLEV6574_g00173 [Synchytrium endobioticum]
MARAPRPRWVRRDGRLVRIDDAEETHIVEERERRPAMRMDALGQQNRSSPATKRQKKWPVTRTRPTRRPAARQPTTRIRPPPQSPPSTPPPRPRISKEHASPAFIVPDPIDLDFPYPDDDEAAGDVHTQPDMEAYRRLPVGLRQESKLFVERLAAALGSRASAEAKRLMTSMTDRCLILSPPQGPDELANIVVGATAVALAYDDSSVEVFPLLAGITGLGRAFIVRLQRAVLRAIDYKV